MSQQPADFTVGQIGELVAVAAGGYEARIKELEAENAHLRAALHRLRDLGAGMSRSWYVREIDDGLDVPSRRKERERNGTSET
jgi:hypothetical protein